MSEDAQGCKHCWHDRGSYTTSAGSFQSRQCCYCGAWETIDITPRYPYGDGTYTPPQHGPFQPTEIVWY